ncbi:MAG: glutamyl-tRNA reductase [Planctomycetia bacterium]|nr:glutamyl-tRNA reductase [Planctomycetia bacterium]
MKLMFFGLSHQTAPIEIRERFSFNQDRLNEILHLWRNDFGNYEAVLVSTCNRTEFYVAGNESLPDEDTIFHFLSNGEKEEEERLRPYFRVLSDDDAVGHLFRVVSSLESMVVGEPQISAQVKSAYQSAAENGTTGSITHAAFQTALKVAKRISVETELFRHRVSIPSIAVVDFALNLFERLEDKKTVVLGAGEMGQETVRYLADHGARSFTIINRSPERAKEIAEQWNGTVDPWEKRIEALVNADLVIAATGSPDPIITAEEFKPILISRRSRPLFLLDLSLPRNIDPKIGSLPDVYLYSIDDLQEACKRNTQKRDREIPKAQKIIHQETTRFIQEMHRRDSDEVIRQLRKTWYEIKDEELVRLFHKCPEVDQKTEEEIRYAFDRLVNKLLHPPMESLKDETREEGGSRLADIIKRLFRLDS